MDARCGKGVEASGSKARQQRYWHVRGRDRDRKLWSFNKLPNLEDVFGISWEESESSKCVWTRDACLSSLGGLHSNFGREWLLPEGSSNNVNNVSFILNELQVLNKANALCQWSNISWKWQPVIKLLTPGTHIIVRRVVCPRGRLGESLQFTLHWHNV